MFRPTTSPFDALAECLLLIRFPNQEDAESAIAHWKRELPRGPEGLRSAMARPRCVSSPRMGNGTPIRVFCCLLTDSKNSSLLPVKHPYVIRTYLRF